MFSMFGKACLLTIVFIIMLMHRGVKSSSEDSEEIDNIKDKLNFILSVYPCFKRHTEYDYDSKTIKRDYTSRTSSTNEDNEIKLPPKENDTEGEPGTRIKKHRRIVVKADGMPSWFSNDPFIGALWPKSNGKRNELDCEK